MFVCVSIDLMSFQVEDLGPQMVVEEGFVAVEEAPREDEEGEEVEVAAEGALEEGIRS